MKDFLLIPSIDLMDGQVVRLTQGRADRKMVYSDNPPEIARSFELSGARRLHVVDLDGAFSGKPSNINIIRAIRERIQIPIEVGGGLRSESEIEALFGIGIDYVILGTAAVESPALVAKMLEAHDRRIIVGLDAHDGKAATRGWLDVSEFDVVALAGKLEEAGVQTIIYTDISRDGTLEGPNLEAQRRMAGSVGMSVIASGGVRSLDDVIALASLPCPNMTGVIVGKALYTGDLDLAEAVKALEERAVSPSDG